VSHGECIGITGPNGSGKTTLLTLIRGLNQPQSNPEQEALIANIQSETQKNNSAIQKDISEMNQKAVNSMQAIIDSYKKQLEAGVAITPEQQQALFMQTELVMMTQEKLASIVIQ
jgi:ATPase subunit of ABC transporter with duplicated ATPase domains